MADDILNGLLSKARGGDTSPSSSLDTPVLASMPADRRKSLRYDVPELDEYAGFVERRHGLPEGLLKAIKNLGERSNSNQVSPKGARGVMQFIPSTWSQYGNGDPTDPVASIDAAGAYLRDLYQRYNGNVDAVITEYNGGIKQGKAVMAGGTPWIPETIQYLQRVKSGMARQPAPGQGGTGPDSMDLSKPLPVVSDPSIQPNTNLFRAAQADDEQRRAFEKQGALRRGFGVVWPQAKQAAGAGMAMLGSKTGNKDLQQSGFDLFADASREAQKYEDPSASLSNVIDGKGSLGDFAKYWIGNGLGQAVESAITGLAGAAVGGAAGSVVPGAGNAAGAVSGFIGGVIGKGAVKKALAEGAEKLMVREVEAGVAKGLTREAAEAAAAPVVKNWVSAETKKAGVRALAATGASAGLYTQNMGMELGEIYGHYIDQMVQSGRPITVEDENLALQSAMAAAGIETLADMAGIGRVLGGGEKAARGALSTIGKEVALGIGREVPTEVAQTAVERFGKRQPLGDADAIRDYVDAAGGAAVPGAMFGGAAGVKRAMAPNSPLSRAADAGAGGIPPAVPGATPGAPGAPSGPASGATGGNTGAPVGGAAGMSPGQAPGGQSADPLSQKVEELRPFLEDKELIRSIRGLPELGPESVNELLAAWAIARNPNTDPAVRERLLDQVGQFVNSVQNRPNWTFGRQPGVQQSAPDASGLPVPASQPAGAQPQARQLTDSGMTMDGQAREVPPSQLKAPPKPALETAGALQQRANAVAEYEQAFQDLVKAEALGESGAELQAKQQAVQEAEAFKQQAEARLKEIRETIEGNRRIETERKRGALLDSILADEQTANPAGRFQAELQRQGYADTAIQPAEQTKIDRFADLQASGIGGVAAPEIEPSAPNELSPYEPPRKSHLESLLAKARAKPKGEASRVSTQPARANAPVGTEGPNQGRRQPEWLENYERVRQNPEAASTKDLYRAANHTASVVRGLRRKAQDGATYSADLLSSMQQEHDYLMSEWRKRASPFETQKATPNLQGRTDERHDQHATEIRNSAPVRAAEGEGLPVPLVAGPWTVEELSDGSLVEDAGHYLRVRDQGGQILASAMDATLQEKDAKLGLGLPGVGGRVGIPPSVAVTYDRDEYGSPDAADEIRVEFGGEAIYLNKVKLDGADEIVGVPPLILEKGEDGELSAFRVEGLPNDLFDFVDAVEQAYALLAEKASRSPKGQEIDEQVAAQLEDRPEPTDAQKEAENYQKAHVSVLGLEISIETEAGAERSGKDKDGSTWSVTLPAHYGYIKGTRGADKDHVDIFLGPKPDNGQFWIINQNHPDTSKFDEHKVMLGYDGAEAAQADYLLSFSGDFGGLVFDSIAGPFSLDEFKAMVPDLAKAKPVRKSVAEVADVKPATPEVESKTDESSLEQALPPDSPAQEVEDEPATSGPPPSIESFKHTKTGETIYSVKLPVQVSSSEYQAINRNAIKHKGRYSSYKAAGVIPEFHFKSEESAKAFAGDLAVFEALNRHSAELKPTSPSAAWKEEGNTDDSPPAVASFFAGESDETPSISRREAEEVVANFRARFPSSPDTSVVERFEDLPAEAQQDAESQGGNRNNVRGVFHNGVIYFVRENHKSRAALETTIAHELIGHFGLRNLLGQDFVQETNKLFVQLGGIDGLRRIAAIEGNTAELDGYARGLAVAYRTAPERFPSEIIKLILTEEVFANVAQKTPTIRRRLKAIIGRLREWLRSLGFFKGQDLNDYDVAAILSRVRSKLSKRSSGAGLERNVTVFGKDDRQVPMAKISEPAEDSPIQRVPLLERAGVSGYAATTGSRPAEIRSALVERFGEEGIAKLERDGLLRIVPNMEAVPEEGRIDGAEAVYDPNNGVAYLIADRLTAGTAAQALLHELGEHHGLEGFIGTPAWRLLKARVASMAQRPGSFTAGAWDGVKAAYDEFHGLTDAELARNDRFIHEVLAKIGESGSERAGSLWRDLLAAIKRGLLRLGFTFQINEDDVRDLVDGSLRRLMRGGDGPGPKGGVLAPQSEAAAPMGSIRENIADFLRTPAAQGDIKNRISDLFRSGRTFNALHRSIGTQYHKAKVDPQHFGRVFNLAQQYIDDVSRTANEAADVAPDLLPKMERMRDAFAQFANVRADERDSRALADPIFSGTMEDRVWSDDELRSRFSLDERQVGLYRQFRAAVDRSLDELALSEMARTAKMSKLEVAPREMGLRQALDFYMEQIGPEAERLEAQMADLKERQAFERNQLEEAAENGESGADGRQKYARLLSAMRARHAGEMDALKAQIENVAEMLKATEGKVAQIEMLKAQGYAPLMRFGQYTVDVFLAGEDGRPLRDASGEEIRHFFGMFESESEANAAARALQEEYPAATVNQGILSQESFRLFKGVTPETVEVFSRLMGEEQSEVFQKYLKQAVSNRSALKRLIQRKGIAGFEKDPVRVLATFLTSNARATSANYHFGDMLRAASDIPREKGDVKDEAVKLIDYVQNPRDEAPALRGLLFMHFLGGSVASAMVNMTQTFTMTYPYLAQFGGNVVGNIKEAMAVAGRRLFNKNADVPEELKAALQRAEDEGVVSPHEIHMLQGESMRTGWFQNNRYMRAFGKVWGSFFSLAEQFNRDVAFISAYRSAMERNLGDEEAYAFAKGAVQETQGVYTRAARPNWARGAVGATLFTFKQFSISYMEFLRRLPPRERAIALGVLWVFAGLSGMPFSDDLDDLIDTIAHMLGFAWDNKAGRRAFLTNVFGKDVSEFIQNGVSAGLPLDISGRMGLANLIPATGLLDPSKDKAKELAEVAGPAGGAIQSYMKAADRIQSGVNGLRDSMDVALQLAPVAITNAYKGMQMLRDGYATDSRGRRTVDTDAWDALYKGIGFNPSVVAESSRAREEIFNASTMLRDMKSRISERWALGIAHGQPDQVVEARAMLRRWNADNPDSPIRIDITNVLRRAKLAKVTAEDRLLKSVPIEMRNAATVLLEQTE